MVSTVFKIVVTLASYCRSVPLHATPVLLKVQSRDCTARKVVELQESQVSNASGVEFSAMETVKVAKDGLHFRTGQSVFISPETLYSRH